MVKDQLHLYRASNHQHVGSVATRGLDVIFGPDILGWTDVLDCRMDPYKSRTIAENCDYATHVRKLYILVGAAQVAQETVPTLAK